MFQTIEEFYALAKTRPRRRVAVAAADDVHTLEALLQAANEGYVFPVLIGDADGIKRKLTQIDNSFSDYELIHETDTIKMAKIAVELVKNKQASFIMKGMLNTGTLLKEVVSKENGLNISGIISHVTLMEIPGYHKILSITDCGIVISPTAQQKAAIIQNAVNLLLAAGYKKPKVAALSTVEFINPKMQDTLDAEEVKNMNRKNLIQNCIVEGPVSFDIAMNKKAAELKGYQGIIPGDVDILLVPNISSGNILVKALGRFVPGIQSVSLAVGADIPIVVTSRGTPAAGKYRSLIAAVAFSKE